MLRKYLSLCLLGLLAWAPFAGAAYNQALNMPEAPEVVETGNGFVTLQWEPMNSAVDPNATVESYKLFYSTAPFTGEENEYIEIFGDNKGTVTGLTNGVPYYFTTVAVDSDQKESYNFSPTAKATPEGDGSDISTDNLHSAGTVALVKADAVSLSEVRMIFNSNIVLPDEDPELAFTVYEKGNPSNLVEITEAKVDELNPKLVTIKTAPMTTGTSYLLIAGVNIRNTDGEYVRSGVIDRTEFTPTATSTTTPTDTTTDTTTTDTTTTPDTDTASGSTIPEDTDTDMEVEEPLTLQEVEYLTATLKQVAERFMILLEWQLPTMEDGATEQKVYQSTDGKLFSLLTSLAPTATSYEATNLTAGQKYWYKITRGNGTEESQGVLSKVVELPASGPGALVFLGGAAMGSVAFIRRRFN